MYLVHIIQYSSILNFGLSYPSRSSKKTSVFLQNSLAVLVNVMVHILKCVGIAITKPAFTKVWINDFSNYVVVAIQLFVFTAEYA